MNLKHLRFFITVAQELHFRKAADRLEITQGPLSLAIQSLEEDLGTRLFDRTRRAVTLTAAGQALYDDAPAILERIENARRHVHRVASGESGRLRLGFTSASSLLPFFSLAISSYRALRPDVVVALQEQPSSLQLQALLTEEIDAGILRPRSPNQGPDLVLKHLMDEPLLVALNQNHRLAKCTDLSLDELRDEAFISYPSDSGVVLYETIMILCGKRSFVPRVVQEAREASTIIGLAAAGLGIAVVPSGLRSITLPGVTFKPLRDPDAFSALYFGYRYGNASPVVHAFAKQLEKYCHSHSGSEN